MEKGSQAILTHETFACAPFGLSTIKRHFDLVGATLVLTTANSHTNGQRASIAHTYGVGSTSYSYNRNRLTDITYKTSAGGSVSKRVHYAYDSSDQRIAKQVDANGDNTYESAEQYVYDGDQVVLILNASGTVISRFMQGVEVDQTIAQEQGGNVQWYLSDHENTVRRVINNTGALGDNITYGAFGNIISQTDAVGNPLPANSNDIPRFSYTGREWDADANLFYYRARWFDAAAGRFINQDPIGFAAGDGNLYRYCGNNPLNAIDPTGTIDYNPGGGREFRGNSPSQNYDNRYGTSSGNGGGGNAKPAPTPVYASVNAVKTQVNSQHDTRVNMAISGGGGTNYYSGSSGTGGGAVASTRVWGSDPIQVALGDSMLVNSIYTGQSPTRRYVYGTTTTAPEPDFSIYGPIQGLPPAGSGISQDEQDFQNSSGVFGPPAPIKQPAGPFFNLMGTSGLGMSTSWQVQIYPATSGSNLSVSNVLDSFGGVVNIGSLGSSSWASQGSASWDTTVADWLSYKPAYSSFAPATNTGQSFSSIASQVAGDMWSDVKWGGQLGGAVASDGIHFVGQMAVGYGETTAVLPVPAAMTPAPTTTPGALGRNVGRSIAGAQGIVETWLGWGLAGGGGAVSTTGVGAVAGVPAMAIGGGMVVHGAATGARAISLGAVPLGGGSATGTFFSQNAAGANSSSSNGGRSGKQARLNELADDPNVSSADRGWIRNEQRQVQQGNRDTVRNPPGKDLAHERGREAVKGYPYEHSNLQDRDLHKLQHKYDDFGKANRERPVNGD